MRRHKNGNLSENNQTMFNKNWRKKDLSKQATEEAKFKIHNKGYNGSQLSLNSFELLNDRLFCG